MLVACILLVTQSDIMRFMRKTSPQADKLTVSLLKQTRTVQIRQLLWCKAAIQIHTSFNMIIFHGSTKTLSSFLFSSFICCVIIFGKTTQARILPLLWSASYKSEKADAFDLGTGSIGSGKQFDYVQSVPNVTLILPSRLQNNTNPQHLLLQKSAFDTVRLNLQQATSNNKWIIKIYGEGTEHKFPPFLERIIQRIQTYFSVYKYTDTSEIGSSTISLDSIAANDVVTKENLSSLDTTSVKEGISNMTQPLNSFKDESTVQENNADLIEFIAIGEYDDDYKVMAED